MQQPEPQGIQRYLGKNLIAAEGEKIGTVEEFFYNKLTEVPAWMAIRAGFLGTRRLVVPVAGSSFEADGVHTPYAKEMISDEPDVEPEESLTPEAESALSAYFGLGAAESTGGSTAR